MCDTVDNRADDYVGGMTRVQRIDLNDMDLYRLWSPKRAQWLHAISIGYTTHWKEARLFTRAEVLQILG